MLKFSLFVFFVLFFFDKKLLVRQLFVWITTNYTLYEPWSRVNWADLMAAQGAFGTDFYDRSSLPER